MLPTNMPAERGFFAARLKELRASAGLSQNGLAEAAGVPVGTLRHFEYGLREPTYDTLVKLSEGLGVSLSAFDPPPSTKPSKPKPASKATDEAPANFESKRGKKSVATEVQAPAPKRPRRKPKK